MKHHKANRKFGREKNVRNALIKSLVRSLVLHKKIETTEARAKEIRPVVEKLITRAKVDTLANKRAITIVVGEDGSKEIFTLAKDQFSDRNGGYTRITKLGMKRTTGAPMAVIEFV